jgi:hypothetical protein
MCFYNQLWRCASIIDESSVDFRIFPVWGFLIRKKICITTLLSRFNHLMRPRYVSNCLENPSEICIISQTLSKFMRCRADTFPHFWRIPTLICVQSCYLATKFAISALQSNLISCHCHYGNLLLDQKFTPV